MIYLYDGSFYGLLTCVYEHYYVEEANEIFDTHRFMGTLIDESKFIDTDDEKATKVEAAIRDKFSMIGYMDMYRSFLSDETYKDCYILTYIVNGFKYGAKMDRLYSEPFVLKIRELSRRVGFEAHRFNGLLRFVEKKPFLYAEFEPDNDILELIAEHFSDRFLNERIIIHDLKREKAVFAYEGKWMIHDIHGQSGLTEVQSSKITTGEVLLQQLWQGYFDHIGIEGRKNLKLQQSFVPLKYRKHLLEFNYSS